VRDVLIVAATRKTRAQFERGRYLGLSLRRLAFDTRIKTAITYRNTEGLPTIFNRQIVKRNRNKILVFIHDDVRIDDYWLSARLDEGLRNFDILGVAGNRRRIRHQPAWAFTSDGSWHERRHLSGAVCHSNASDKMVSFYGNPRQRCKLLDGAFLAVKAASLLDREVRFDDRFGFHFYDLDFCRSAEERGLTAGTWPIAITHASGGSFLSREWKKALEQYRLKWDD
jgi:GT2 family glycosyltransferase